MKYARWFWVFFIVWFMLWNSGITIFATTTEVEGETLSEDDKKKVLSSVNISLLTEEPTKKGIKCFNVSDDGLIAIGCSLSANDHMVCVYDSEGVFQYGYRFTAHGSFGIDWTASSIVICLVRGEIAISLDQNGKAIDIWNIPLNETNNRYWNDLLYGCERTRGDIVYIVKNDMGFFNLFASTASQLYVKEPNNPMRLVYDINATQLVKIVFIVIIVFVGVAISLIFVFGNLVKHLKKR